MSKVLDDQTQVRVDYKRIMRLVDPLVGVVSHTHLQFREPDDPYIFNAISLLANTRAGISHPRIGSPPQGNGAAGISKMACITSAVGESLERYGCSIIDFETEIYGSYDELTSKGYNCFPPERVALFSDLQYRSRGFPFSPFGRESQVSWTKAELLSPGSSQEVYYPSCLIFMPYIPDRTRSEQILAPTISTGQACGTGLDRATLTGLMEAVERDAYVISWQGQLENRQLDPSTSSVVSTFLKERFANTPIDVCLNLLTLDVPIPVVMATGVDRLNKSISCVVGVAANPDPEIAAIKALTELAQDRFYVKYLAKARSPVLASETFEHIDDFEKRVILYLQPNMIRALDFWRVQNSVPISFNNAPRIEGGGVESNLKECIRLISNAGGTVIRKNCTPADLASEGLCVVKVIIPEFGELEGNHLLRFLGCQRIYSVPVSLGFRPKGFSEKDLNINPHPLP